MTSRFLWILAWLGWASSAWTAAGAGMRVATLHPLLTDLAEGIGGSHITVIPIARPGTDMHTFSPSTRDMQELSGAAIVLASGKKLENYLGKLRDNLTKGQVLLEVGESIPSIPMSEAAAMLETAGSTSGEGTVAHAHGAVDPHWWNSVENMQRAGRVVSAAFSKADPANAKAYQSNAVAWERQLSDLKKWARREISRIPPESRKLATSHLALSYFASEFGFRLIPVQGMNPEVPASSRDVAAAIDVIRRSKVAAVFPEQGVNPKLLQKIAEETGVKVGGDLVADGNGSGPLATFAGAFSHNVKTIVEALAPAAP